MYFLLVLAQAQSTSATGTGGGPASGGPPPGGGGGGGLDPLSMMLLLALVVGVMWFIVFRPQRKQEKKRREMLAQMSRNDHVVTIGGIHGIVYSVDETSVVLKIDERNDVRIRVTKSAIAQVLERSQERGEQAKDEPASS